LDKQEATLELLLDYDVNANPDDIIRLCKLKFWRVLELMLDRITLTQYDVIRIFIKCGKIKRLESIFDSKGYDISNVMLPSD